MNLRARAPDASSMRPPHTDEAGLSAAARDALSRYLDVLAKWNRVYNLTAIRDRVQMESHHVRDALAVLPFLPDAPSLQVLDVGSGGGIPGIPLAIVRPAWQITLVDSNRKKVAFLTQAAIELGLANVRAIASRVEDMQSDKPFDVVISRAFSDLRTFAMLAGRHVARDGVLVAMKGAFPSDEIAELPSDVQVTATPALDVPGLDAKRHLVIMRIARKAHA